MEWDYADFTYTTVKIEDLLSYNDCLMHLSFFHLTSQGNCKKLVSRKDMKASRGEREKRKDKKLGEWAKAPSPNP